MTNDEFPMTKECQSDARIQQFVIRHSLVIRHSSFVISATLIPGFTRLV